jgi:hypothetical protein
VTTPRAPFVVDGSYLDRSYYVDEITREGFELTFASEHRPLGSYAAALADAGLLIELIREHKLPTGASAQSRSRRWQRIPLFLHIRALKPQPVDNSGARSS